MCERHARRAFRYIARAVTRHHVRTSLEQLTRLDWRMISARDVGVNVLVAVAPRLGLVGRLALRPPALVSDFPRLHSAATSPPTP